MTHQLDWEMRLEIAGSLQRSQGCRTQDEVLDTSAQWKAAMMGEGLGVSEGARVELGCSAAVT
jgi:hypothetical protein